MSVQPEEDQFKDWMQHPVTEWVFSLCQKHGEAMRDAWARKAWESEQLLPEAFLEARVRADCYADIATSSFEDWKAIDDPET